jgi:hypothetical protein
MSAVGLWAVLHTIPLDETGDPPVSVTSPPPEALTGVIFVTGEVVTVANVPTLSSSWQPARNSIITMPKKVAESLRFAFMKKYS